MVLTRNIPHDLRSLNIWSLVGGAVLGGCRTFVMGPLGGYKSIEAKVEVYRFDSVLPKPAFYSTEMRAGHPT